MNKFIGLLVLAGITIYGISKLVVYFQDPDFEEITIQEIDSLGTAGLKYVHITKGMSTGDYIYSQNEKSGSIIGVTYPLINIENAQSEVDTNKLRTKVVVSDLKADSVSLGFPEVIGRVKSDRLTTEEVNLMSESYLLDSDYIVVENKWEKPSLWFALLLTIIPGLLLYMNIRIFFAKKKSSQMPPQVNPN